MAELVRRDFLKMVGLSAGAAATAGCDDPAVKLIPYVIQPEEITPGLRYVYYASTCRGVLAAACGLHVKTREGRPIKLEGNPDHPINQGRLCARGQASASAAPTTRTAIRVPMQRGAERRARQPITWEDARAELAPEARCNARHARPGSSARAVGPTLDSVIDDFADCEGRRRDPRRPTRPFGHDALRAATKAAFGVNAAADLRRVQADLDRRRRIGLHRHRRISPTEHSRPVRRERAIVKQHAQGRRRATRLAWSPRLEPDGHQRRHLDPRPQAPARRDASRWRSRNRSTSADCPSWASTARLVGRSSESRPPPGDRAAGIDRGEGSTTPLRRGAA